LAECKKISPTLEYSLFDFTEQAGAAARRLDYICEVHGANIGQDNVFSGSEILLFSSDTHRKFRYLTLIRPRPFVSLSLEAPDESISHPATQNYVVFDTDSVIK